MILLNSQMEQLQSSAIVHGVTLFSAASRTSLAAAALNRQMGG
jgi:hypothetical protein